MYVWQMNNGRWQLDLLTSRRGDKRLAAAMDAVKGSYETQAEAEAVKARSMAHV